MLVRGSIVRERLPEYLPAHRLTSSATCHSLSRWIGSTKDARNERAHVFADELAHLYRDGLRRVHLFVQELDDVEQLAWNDVGHEYEAQETRLKVGLHLLPERVNV